MCDKTEWNREIYLGDKTARFLQQVDIVSLV